MEHSFFSGVYMPLSNSKHLKHWNKPPLNQWDIHKSNKLMLLKIEQISMQEYVQRDTPRIVQIHNDIEQRIINQDTDILGLA